jgi:nicotinate phosphoribosyltransferase
MEEKGNSLIGVRLDSGDMTAFSKEVRHLLDAEGLSHVKIFASSGFDEFKISDALASGAMIDAFGVGTKMGVSADAPYLDIVYKLVRFNDRNVRKLSPGKATLGGKKQVFRKYDVHGIAREDIIGNRDERVDPAKPLMEKVMIDGKPLKPNPPLNEIKNRFASSLSTIPEKYKSVHERKEYPVKISEHLKKAQESA